MDLSFDRYELLKRIAAGGMGEVFLARQRGMEGFEKYLAVKVLLPHLVEDRKFVAMFRDEARIAARLNHSNLAHTYEVGQARNGRDYIAMEYIDGEDVVHLWQTALDKNMPVPPALAARIVADAAAGLDYAHKAVDSNNRPLRVVHRDVSPHNIRVTFDGEVKVIDFGIAMAAGRTSDTATGTLKGKYSYMSPEQAQSKPVDLRSDVFALGVILYELVTSIRLFKRDTELATLRAVEECKVPRPTEANPAIDRQLESIVLRALARDPEARFPDAAALRLALEDWIVQGRLPGSSAHLGAFVRKVFPNRSASAPADGKPVPEGKGTPSPASRPTSVSWLPREPRRPRTPTPVTSLLPGTRRRRLGLVAGAAVMASAVASTALFARSRWVLPPSVSHEVPSTSLAMSSHAGGRPADTPPIEAHPLCSDPGFSVAGSPQRDAPVQVVLKLTSFPVDATVALGSQILGTTPVEYRTAASEAELTFTFRLAGYKTQKRTVAPRADIEVAATLAKAPSVGRRPPSRPEEELGIMMSR